MRYRISLDYPSSDTNTVSHIANSELDAVLAATQFISTYSTPLPIDDVMRPFLWGNPSITITPLVSLTKEN
jgi:hypothetical protein